MSEVEILEIEKRTNNAQNGPWKAFVEGRDHYSGSNFIMVNEGSEHEINFEISGATIEDYDFIANARQDIPLLIAEIRRLKSGI